MSLKSISITNGDYPEISFSFISQVVEGMMGIRPNAKDSAITVTPNLPDEIRDIKLFGLKVGNNCLTLK
ncbi:MAG: hypothetical protein IJR70_08725 [Eubacterium sp.]|nr:hypothetical protein [Eubacterium sp.]